MKIALRVFDVSIIQDYLTTSVAVQAEIGGQSQIQQRGLRHQDLIYAKVGSKQDHWLAINSKKSPSDTHQFICWAFKLTHLVPLRQRKDLKP